MLILVALELVVVVVARSNIVVACITKGTLHQNKLIHVFYDTQNNFHLVKGTPKLAGALIKIITHIHTFTRLNISLFSANILTFFDDLL